MLIYFIVIRQRSILSR